MHYVLLRDDDTSGLTPPALLERIYAPVVDRGLPVHLSVIPNVHTRSTLPDGSPEWFLPNDPASLPETVPIGNNPRLVSYLQSRGGFHVLQHGYEHRFQEFLSDDAHAVARAITRGSELLAEAGLGHPEGFVAPQDRISGPALRALASRFRMVSTCWFERSQVRGRWWLPYAVKKLRRTPHWRVGGCTLLSHPGSLLAHTRDYRSQLPRLQESVRSRRLTVVVTHWWEYFRREQFDAAMLDVLHETAAWLASARDVRVITLDDIVAGRVPLA